MFRPKQQPSAFAVQSAPSAFAVPPPANAASAVGLPPLPQLHRSESEISLDAFGIFPSGAPRAPSTASVTSMISALRIGAIYAPDAKMMVRSPSIAYSTVSEFSAVGDAKDAAAARNNMPMQLVPEAVAQVFLPPSMDGSTPIDARIWNCVNGTGRYAQEDVDSTDFLAGTRQGPGGNVATISFYDGRTIKADEAVNQGFLKVRAPLSLRKQEEMENAGHETQRKMQSSLTLQGSTATITGIPLNSHIFPRALLRLSDIELKMHPSQNKAKLTSVFCRVVVQVPGLEPQTYTTVPRSLMPVPGSKTGFSAGLQTGFIFDSPTGYAKVEVGIYATKVVKQGSSSLGSRLNSFFRPGSKHANPQNSAFQSQQSAETEMIGSYVVEIGQKAKTSATQILLVESSNPKLVRSIKIKFQAMQYLDEPWMEDDMDEEIEKSVATESQPAVSDTKWELPTKTGHVCIMSINASGKPSWRTYPVVLSDGCFTIYSDRTPDVPMAQLPLSNLICIQPPEDSSSMPTNSVVELIFRPADVSAEDYCMTEDQRNWLSTVIYDNKFAFYTDSKENSASWAYALQVTQPEAGIRGFTMPGPDQDGLERVGTLLNIIPEEEEEGY